jgi:hypothetical protein
MPRVFANGGILGKTLDFNTTSVYDAIQYVGGATASARDTGTVTVTFTSLTGGIGGGVLTDDVVVVATALGKNSNVAMTMSTAGYTTLFDLYGDDNDDTNLGIFYKVMGATPDTSATTGNTLTTNDTAVLGVQVWRRVNTSTPIGVSGSFVSSNTGDPNPPAITTGTRGSLVIAVGSSGHTQGTVLATQGGDLENFITDGQNAGQSDSTLGMGSVISSPTRPAGTSVDPIAFVVNGTGINSSAAAATFELIPKTPVVLRNSGVWDIGWRYAENTG